MCSSKLPFNVLSAEQSHGGWRSRITSGNNITVGSKKGELRGHAVMASDLTLLMAAYNQRIKSIQKEYLH